jgi:hypothetical protein
MNKAGLNRVEPRIQASLSFTAGALFILALFVTAKSIAGKFLYKGGYRRV